MGTLIPLDESNTTELGGKGTGVAWLLRQGFNTPRTWIVADFTDDRLDLSELDPQGRYAVRSSADVEDGAEASFAGQFLTSLDVAGADAITAAVGAVRDSASSPNVAAYASERGVAHTPSVTVLIQEMVPPVASGVVFTRNPITGLDESVLEAVEGRGDRLVQDGVTPHRWIRRWGAWTDTPDNPSLPDAVATAIVTEARRIADDYGKPADLEWVWDGEDVWWVQVRPITAIDDVGVYSNRISKEVMPGLIKPLVWSVNVPVVNRAWIRLFQEAAGPRLNLEPEDLAKQFAYRSYFNMAAIGDIFEAVGMPRDSLELLLGLPEGPAKPSFKPSVATMRKVPRLMAFAARRSSFGRRIDKVVGPLRAAYEPFDRDPADMSDTEILAAVREMMVIGTTAAYANIVIPLLANLYSTLLRKGLARRGLDLAEVDLGVDASAVDPNHHLGLLARIIEEEGWESDAGRRETGEFLSRFGHLSDSGNDFSAPHWRETPELVRTMAETLRSSPGSQPRRPWSSVASEFGIAVRAAVNALRRRAVRYQEGREHISDLYTWGYGLFRLYFLELGRRLAERKIIDDRDDVMYLALEDLERVVRGDMTPDETKAVVGAHRTEMERVSDVAMPEVIYGDDFVASSPTGAASTLRGVGTSRGHYRGPACVVKGAADFAKLRDGDVLVIPYSDVGWTPLFARAGAVVAESGGMLSHSSIVAREYGIPCVVSVPGATSLEGGTVVTVDAYLGKVTVG